MVMIFTIIDYTNPKSRKDLHGFENIIFKNLKNKAFPVRHYLTKGVPIINFSYVGYTQLKIGHYRILYH